MNLLTELEHTRALMIQSGMKYGFQNVKTIQLSKKLDILMNEYEQLATNEKNIEFYEKESINNFKKNVYI